MKNSTETKSNNVKTTFTELNKKVKGLIEQKIKELSAYVTNNEYSFISSNEYLLNMIAGLKTATIEFKKFGLAFYISIDSKTKIESVDFAKFKKEWYSKETAQSEGYFRNALDYYLDTKGKANNFYFDLVMIPKLTLESDYNRMKKELQLNKDTNVSPSFKKGVCTVQTYNVFTPNLPLLMKDKTSEVNAPAYFLRRYEELVLTIAKICQGKKLEPVQKVETKKHDKKGVAAKKEVKKVVSSKKK